MSEETTKDEAQTIEGGQGAKTARRGRGVGFAAMKDYINKAEPALGSTNAISSPVESPALRKRPVDPVAAEPVAFQLALPVSKQLLEMSFQELDPRRCFPSPLNPRVQSLLSLDDPEIARIKESFEREDQREPVKARLHTAADGSSSWEVVEGTTRLFIAKSLTEERGALFPLKAWVGPIPDIDIRRLAKSENRDRRDLSAWETSIALADDVQTIYKNRTQEYIATLEGRSQTEVSQLLKLAQLDQRVVKLVVTPGQISLKAGIQLVDLWAALSAQEIGAVLASLLEKAPYADAAALVKELKSIAARKTAASVALKKNEPLLVNSKKGDLVARLSPHRSNAGQFKLDMFSFTDGDAVKVMEFIRKLRGG